MAAGGTFSIEVVRGDVVESVHSVHAVISDRTGKIQAWGDRTRPTIARSAIKSIQALPLITTGAADALDVGEEELALACASHSGETDHVEAVLSWLNRLGLSEADLECGPDRPLGAAAKREFLAARREMSPVFNCCSGKHAGFLTLSRHLDAPTAGYIQRSSAAQKLVTGAVEAMTDLDLADLPSGIDGCGIPVFALPLQRLAFAMARLVDPVDLESDLAEATGRVVQAARRSFWVSGTGRTESFVEESATEPVVVKTGAEGMFMAGIPGQGLGIALKVADGTSRASRAAIKAVLRDLGVLPIDAEPVPTPLLNKAGNLAGELRVRLSAPETATLD